MGGPDWYRATVLEVYADGTVKVEYVDYGNTEVVPVTDMRPATDQYTTLPLQAFRCSLHGGFHGLIIFNGKYQSVHYFKNRYSIIMI